jgi:hypothetical protein
VVADRQPPTQPTPDPVTVMRSGTSRFSASRSTGRSVYPPISLPGVAKLTGVDHAVGGSVYAEPLRYQDQYPWFRGALRKNKGGYTDLWVILWAEKRVVSRVGVVLSGPLVARPRTGRSGLAERPVDVQLAGWTDVASC